MIDYMIAAVILAILGFAGWYIYKSKKSGKKCIGCPDGCCTSGESGSCSCCCGCQSSEK